MQMKPGVVVLHMLTALVSGCWAIYLMGLPSIGGPWSWWYPVIFGASIILLVESLHALVRRLKPGWLVIIASAIALLPWNLEVWLRDGLIFAVAIAVATWCALTITSLCKRPWLTSLFAIGLLVAWWVPISLRTLRAYFSPTGVVLVSSGLLWTLTPTVLALASLIAMVLASREPAFRQDSSR